MTVEAIVQYQVELSWHPDALVPLSVARQLCGNISRAHAYRLIRAGKFPAPVKISAARVGYRCGDIAVFLKDPTSYRSGS